MRVLPGGDVVIADDARALLARVDRTGDARTLTRAINNPNGIELGPRGQLYATDFGGGDVFRVDPETGTAVAAGRAAEGVNGLTFDPRYTVLFVADHDMGILYAMDLAADGALQPPRELARGLGRPDGLTTDECGNIYAASWDKKVYRVSPTGTVTVLAELTTTVSAVRFGSGRHGWDDRSLYVMNIQEGGVYEIKLGVHGAPPPR
jgi:sugar lactone lactonase YvrE